MINSKTLPMPTKYLATFHEQFFFESGIFSPFCSSNAASQMPVVVHFSRETLQSPVCWNPCNLTIVYGYLQTFCANNFAFEIGKKNISTFFSAVSCRASITRIISSKFLPVHKKRSVMLCRLGHLLLLNNTFK